MDSTKILKPFVGAGRFNAKALDVSEIKGNVSEEMRRESLAAFRYFVSTQGNSYGAEVGERIKMTSVNIRGERGETCAETTFEITVEKHMCNIFGTLHGACAAYIVDPCSVSSLVALGRTQGVDGTGVSQSMNLIWHHPVRQGTRLRVVSTSMSLKGRVRTARCELWDGDVLCVSAVHSTVNPAQKRSKSKM